MSQRILGFNMKKIKVTMIKSMIGRTQRQRNTLGGLGLRKIGQSRVHNATPQILGMLNKVNFLINVEDVNE